MNNINKLLEKPIVIEHKKEESSKSSDVYEEKEDIDYIEESRTLKDIEKGKGKTAHDDSI